MRKLRLSPSVLLGLGLFFLVLGGRQHGVAVGGSVTPQISINATLLASPLETGFSVGLFSRRVINLDSVGAEMSFAVNSSRPATRRGVVRMGCHHLGHAPAMLMQHCVLPIPEEFPHEVASGPKRSVTNPLLTVPTNDRSLNLSVGLWSETRRGGAHIGPSKANSCGLHATCGLSAV